MYVILFGVGAAGDCVGASPTTQASAATAGADGAGMPAASSGAAGEGIYSLRAFGPDGLPQETIVAWELEDDATR
jgi:hypothetical protein